MAIFENGEVRLSYEEHGSGFPVLLIAPGGMRSAVSYWRNTPWDPIEQLSPNYRVIAMDQRNAGGSTAPVRASDGWGTYTADQLALLDHLGVDRFHVAGMCIGGPYVMGLVQAAPQRVASGTLFQPIGLDGNREAFYEMFDSWAADIAGEHPGASPADWAAFREAMYGGDDMLFNVTDDFVATCPTPLLVFLGNDLYHPESTSRRVVELAPDATLVERWKGPDDVELAQKAFEAFLGRHTP